jgi:hypothetical protein
VYSRDHLLISWMRRKPQLCRAGIEDVERFSVDKSGRAVHSRSGPCVDSSREVIGHGTVAFFDSAPPVVPSSR